MQVSLVCGAPGAGLSKVAARLGAELKTDNSVEVIDLDELIVQQACSSNSGPFAGMKDGGLPELCEHTRGAVQHLWSETTHEFLSSSEADRVIVFLHLTYFSARTMEFYSPLDVSVFAGSETHVDRVVLLIDDVYDAWARLGDLYSPEQEFDAALLPSSKLHKLDGEQDHDVQALLKYEARLHSFSQLLRWRRAETVMADNAAKQFPSEGADDAGPRFANFTIFGVKQRFEDFKKLVLEEAPRTVYFSHQITAFRRMIHGSLSKGESPSWSAAVGEVGEFAARLCVDGVVPIMPTAIDELRWFSNETDRIEGVSTLSARWPLLASENELCYSRPEQFDSPEAMESILDVVEGVGDLTDVRLRAHAASTARTFEREVFDEIAFRDHMIVEGSDALLVYRPFADRNATTLTPSTGVNSEVAHLNRCRNGGEGWRRLAVVHVLDDLIPAEKHIRKWLRRYFFKHAEAFFVKKYGHESKPFVEDLLKGQKVEQQHLWRVQIDKVADQAVGRNALRTTLSDILSVGGGTTSGNPSATRSDVAVSVVSAVSDLSNEDYLNNLRKFLMDARNTDIADEICNPSWELVCKGVLGDSFEDVYNGLLD